MSEEIHIRPVRESDRQRIEQIMQERWHGVYVMAHGRTFFPAVLPGFVAERKREIVGLVAYHIEEAACEIVVLEALLEQEGVGSRLLEAVTEAAVGAGCDLLCAITTNDNLDALRFYQRRGFRMRAINPGALDDVRRFKPTVPLIGAYGIPLRDEIELEKHL